MQNVSNFQVNSVKLRTFFWSFSWNCRKGIYLCLDLFLTKKHKNNLFSRTIKRITKIRRNRKRNIEKSLPYKHRRIHPTSYISESKNDDAYRTKQEFEEKRRVDRLKVKLRKKFKKIYFVEKSEFEKITQNELL